MSLQGMKSKKKKKKKKKNIGKMIIKKPKIKESGLVD